MKYLQIVKGQGFKDQQKTIIEALKSEFNCTDLEAEYFYYNNALTHVITISGKKDECKRTITKENFLKLINKKNLLFNIWFLETKGKDKYLKELINVLNRCNALYGIKNKYLFIDSSAINLHDANLPLDAFICNLVEHYYKLGKTHYGDMPWTIIIETDNMNNIKKQLLKNNIIFNDGFEWLQFQPNFFNAGPIFQIKNQSNGKITKSSFFLKIIHSQTLISHKNEINKPDVLFYASNKKIAEYFPDTNGVQLYQINACDNLVDISTLLIRRK